MQILLRELSLPLRLLLEGRHQAGSVLRRVPLQRPVVTMRRPHRPIRTRMTLACPVTPHQLLTAVFIHRHLQPLPHILPICMRTPNPLHHLPNTTAPIMLITLTGSLMTMVLVCTTSRLHHKSSNSIITSSMRKPTQTRPRVQACMISASRVCPLGTKRAGYRKLRLQNLCLPRIPYLHHPLMV